MNTQDYTIEGNGPPLILIHGWPFHKEAFRKIVPLLSAHFTCYSVNSLGMGLSGYKGGADMTFAGHAQRIVDFANDMGLTRFSLLAHDTGGTFARIAAAAHPERIEKLVLLNTEMPGHRPPFIPFYQKMTYVPGFKLSLGLLMHSKLFLKSPMGFGGCFHDKSHIDDEEFLGLFVRHWIDNPARFEGLRLYLQGLDFSALETLPEIHQKITAPIQFIWGKDDVTFPVSRAKEMAKSVPTCKEFVEIEDACFLLYEEKPEAVAAHAVRFLKS